MDPNRKGFFRSYVLPALFLFVLPAFAFWFAGHATRRYDDQNREASLAAVEADRDMPPEQRAALREFFERVPLSAYCAEPPQELGADLADTCSSYRQFRIARLTALAALLLGGLSVLVVCLCAAVSFINRTAQYASFVVGWNFLRVTSALQTVGQGALAVWLSFWMTALWFDKYVPKLILIVAVVVAMASFAVIKAIFRSNQSPLELEGELLSETFAPLLWERVRELAKRMGTEPPQRIIAGIDDNFFVTEGRVLLAGRLFEGRTLYVSLSLLKTLEKSEADAVLAHEMAHFSGGDTAFSKKLAPRLGHYGSYLEALHSGGITLPIFYFMLFYWALFQLSLGRSSREREFRADSLAVEQTSSLDIARALVKVAAYSSYRRRVEAQLFEHDRAQSDLDIAGRVQSGFSGYASSEHLHGDLDDSRFPHPFDSHPSLAARLAAVRVDADRAVIDGMLTGSVGSTWLDTIDQAQEIEGRLWGAYEQRFAAAHEQSLAYRYLPNTDEERALVEKFFPGEEWSGGKGAPVILTYRGIRLDGLEQGLDFADMAKVTSAERMFKKYLDIKARPGVEPKKLAICVSDLACDNDAFYATFSRYYGRHLAAVSNQGA